MSPAQIVMAVLLAATLFYTVYAYPNRYGALTGRSRLYRTVGLFLLSLLLMLVFIGTYIDFRADVTPRAGLIRMIFYWASCLMLGLILPVIAFLDSLESFVAVRREKRDYLMNMWQEEQQRLTGIKTGSATGIVEDESEKRSGEPDDRS
ncbi:MAG: hypothetical protein SFU56_14680 [Capsulimonadales bacterium]|nr:hypothetical protein [Capsulimonadales bacterium]